MSHWEAVEFELARLYSVFKTGDSGGPAIQDYGAGRIFRDRISTLDKAAYGYFVRYPHQDREGNYDLLSTRAAGYSDRRNDVAHGIVFNVSGITYFRNRLGLPVNGPEQFLLIAPLYAARWHPTGFSAFAYAYDDLISLTDHLRALGLDIELYRQGLTGQTGEPPLELP